MTDETLICSICEGGPDLGIVCERCEPIVKHISASILAEENKRILDKLGVGEYAYVIAVRRQDGTNPLLAKGWGMDPSPAGRRLEGAPVSMCALWATRGDALEALETYIPADVRKSYGVFKVIVHYVSDEDEG